MRGLLRGVKLSVQDRDLLQAAHPSLMKLKLLTRVDLFSNNVLVSQSLLQPQTGKTDLLYFLSK